MIMPVQVTFRNVASTTEVEEKIRARAQKLEKFYSPITSCRVLVEAPARHRRKGYSFHVRIDLTVPEGEIVVKREPTLYPKEKDIGDERRRKQMENSAGAEAPGSCDPRSFPRRAAPAGGSRSPKARRREDA